ncbi:hypothetical protein L7F22_018564 [Adiantum nelumboides]|nr:hypothetical protein [Adiantum nelumboides]
MAFPTSDKRLRRSQARAGTPAVATKTPMGASTPSSASQNARAFSKAGRRVLAELACNDSPIVGLLPAGTPTSHKSKCSDGGPIRSRRALLASSLPSCPASTPLGESLLRSQVQMLLQKVGSDIYTKQQEKAAGNYVMGASPIMLAAPTPLNTPASTMSLHQPNSQVRDSQLSSQNHATDVFGQVAELSTFLGMLAKHPESNDEILGATLTETHLQSVSTTLCTDVRPPLLLEVSDTPSSSEIFMGKRVLHFDDDTPCNATQEITSSRVCFAEETGEGTPALRQPDDDEVSEWSVSVNVGSPADKQCLVEGIATSSSSSVEEHVENMQQVSTHTAHLLWDEEMQKKALQDEREVEGLWEEDDERYTEDYYGEDENEEEYGDEYEASEDCDDLCDMFRDMDFGEVSRGLPKGEGKHIRFLYEDGDDEIVEAMVVGGEEDVSHSSGAVRLKGLPAPSGRHWRFEQDEE